jgi:hypothetical protein
MDLAGGALVLVAEKTGYRQILTLDSDFLFYRISDHSDLAPFSISGFRRRFAPPKPTFTVCARSARTVNVKGARSEIKRVLRLFQDKRLVDKLM